MYYLIKWKGYHINESTWEAESNFSSLSDDPDYLKILVKYHMTRNIKSINSKIG